MTTSEMSPADFAAINGNGRNGGDGMWGDNGAWWIIVLFLFAGWGRGFGGFGGNDGTGGGSAGYDTRADIQRGFDNQAVITKLDGITHGICDSTYALTNAINSGFSSAELSRCNQQAALMQQLNAMAMQAQDCCCQSQRLTERGFCDVREAIAGVNYNLATQACDTRNVIQNTTRDIIDNANANSRAILDALNQNYIRSLESENQSLKLAASQSNQNAVLMAAMDANKAEILRRSGHDCPSAAYIVQPPTPVNFPTNCCGTFTGFGGGCGCAG